MLKFSFHLVPSFYKKIFGITLFLNILLAIFASDISIFLFRQFIVTIFLILHYFFRDEIEGFSIEDERLENLLKRKYFILRLEGPFLILFILSLVFLSTFSFDATFLPLVLLAYIICLLYVLLSFYKIWCIFHTPEVVDS